MKQNDAAATLLLAAALAAAASAQEPVCRRADTAAVFDYRTYYCDNEYYKVYDGPVRLVPTPMKYLWAVPTQVHHISDEKGMEPPSMHKILAGLAVKAYEQFINDKPMVKWVLRHPQGTGKTLKHFPVDDSTQEAKNDLFYNYQMAASDRDGPPASDEVKALWAHRRFQTFEGYVGETVKSYTEDVIPGEQTDNLEVSYWIEVQGKGFFQKPHIYDHQVGALISGKYVLQVPEGSTSKIVFQDPRANAGPFRYNEWEVTPKAGEMVTFPFYVPHYVTPQFVDGYQAVLCFTVYRNDVQESLFTENPIGTTHHTRLGPLTDFYTLQELPSDALTTLRELILEAKGVREAEYG